MAITIPATNNDDTITNISGQDIIVNGLAGNDTITTGSGKDTITGGLGNDIISTGAGNDIVDGGEGSDVINTGSGDDVITDDGLPFDFNQINAGSGHDVVTVTGSNSNFINLGSGNDVLTATGAAVNGIPQGEVSILQLPSGQFVIADSGNDTVTVGDGSDSVQAGSGNDTVTTGGGFDAVIGLDGNDTVINNDNVIVIEGGEGNDIIIATGDHFEGGTGFDTLSYAFSEEGVNVDLDTGGGTQTAFGGDAEGDFISGFEHVIGGDGNDVLTGNALGNSLIGNGGNDTLDGQGGNDFLDGSLGGDVISDGTGADVVVGGSGADTINLTNDGTTDRVDFDTFSSPDTVNGFNTGVVPGPGDRLDISDLITYADATPTLAEAVAQGFVNFVGENGNADTLMQVDANGGGDVFFNTATLISIAFVDDATSIALFSDNIILT